MRKHEAHCGVEIYKNLQNENAVKRSSHGRPCHSGQKWREPCSLQTKYKTSSSRLERTIRTCRAPSNAKYLMSTILGSTAQNLLVMQTPSGFTKSERRDNYFASGRIRLCLQLQFVRDWGSSDSVLQISRHQYSDCRTAFEQSSALSIEIIAHGQLQKRSMN
jgi:hypothetical protein